MEVLSDKNVNKENRNNQIGKEMQRLKVELNDKIFECHKLEEDYAQERAKMKIGYQFQKNNLNKAIQELKNKNDLDNELWANKV